MLSGDHWVGIPGSPGTRHQRGPAWSILTGNRTRGPPGVATNRPRAVHCGCHASAEGSHTSATGTSTAIRARERQRLRDGRISSPLSSASQSELCAAKALFGASRFWQTPGNARLAASGGARYQPPHPGRVISANRQHQATAGNAYIRSSAPPARPRLPAFSPRCRLHDDRALRQSPPIESPLAWVHLSGAPHRRSRRSRQPAIETFGYRSRELAVFCDFRIPLLLSPYRRLTVFLARAGREDCRVDVGAGIVGRPC